MSVCLSALYACICIWVRVQLVPRFWPFFSFFIFFVFFFPREKSRFRDAAAAPLFPFSLGPILKNVCFCRNTGVFFNMAYFCRTGPFFPVFVTCVTPRQRWPQKRKENLTFPGFQSYLNSKVTETRGMLNLSGVKG